MSYFAKKSWLIFLIIQQGLEWKYVIHAATYTINGKTKNCITSHVEFVI